jgi:hypothetical protein
MSLRIHTGAGEAVEPLPVSLAVWSANRKLSGIDSEISPGSRVVSTDGARGRLLLHLESRRISEIILPLLGKGARETDPKIRLEEAAPTGSW